MKATIKTVLSVVLSYLMVISVLPLSVLSTSAADINLKGEGINILLRLQFLLQLGDDVHAQHLLLAVGLRLFPKGYGGLESVGGAVAGGYLVEKLLEAVADGVLTEVHTEAVLGVILEEGVGPCGAVAVLIDGVGARRSRAAPD